MSLLYFKSGFFNDSKESSLNVYLPLLNIAIIWLYCFKDHFMLPKINLVSNEFSFLLFVFRTTDKESRIIFLTSPDKESRIIFLTSLLLVLPRQPIHKKTSQPQEQTSYLPYPVVLSLN